MLEKRCCPILGWRVEHREVTNHPSSVERTPSPSTIKKVSHCVLRASPDRDGSFLSGRSGGRLFNQLNLEAKVSSLAFTINFIQDARAHERRLRQTIRSRSALPRHALPAGNQPLHSALSTPPLRDFEDRNHRRRKAPGVNQRRPWRAHHAEPFA